MGSNYASAGGFHSKNLFSKIDKLLKVCTEQGEGVSWLRVSTDDEIRIDECEIDTREKRREQLRKHRHRDTETEQMIL